MTDTPSPKTTARDVFSITGKSPREASAFKKGVAAQRRGTRLDANPFHMATSIQAANFRQWREGWQVAEKKANRGR